MISIIIPTYNEEAHLKKTVEYLRKHDTGGYISEIIITDGGSTDDTLLVGNIAPVITTISKQKGRAAQINHGASLATSEIVYFLHADSIPPKDFVSQVVKAYHNGAVSGCFRLVFDYDHWFLKANAWFTRFNINAVRFGDQSLFVTKTVFKLAGGFKESLLMMEDQEIIHRLKKHGKFVVMNGVIVTSARKYLDNGIFRMQFIFFKIWSCYYLGYSQQKLLHMHRKLIRSHKL